MKATACAELPISPLRYHSFMLKQQGSTGSVFAAIQTETNLQVAIKVVDITTPKARTSFFKEIEILFTLKNCKHCIAIYEYIVQENQGFIIMEYMKHDLYELCSEYIDEKRAKNIFSQIVCGLHEIHNRSIFHLDIKPENILVDELDNIKFCDFGCSVLVPEPLNKGGERVQLNGKAGSAYYMAPEMKSDGSYYGDTADVWSLGVMFYFVLTNSFPVDVNYNLLLDRLKDRKSFLLTDFLRQILQISPSCRLSLPDLMCHPWLELQLINKQNTSCAESNTNCGWNNDDIDYYLDSRENRRH